MGCIICKTMSSCSDSCGDVLDNPIAKILLTIAAVVFTILGFLSYHGKIANASVSYFLGAGFFFGATLVTSLLAASFCQRAQAPK